MKEFYLKTKLILILMLITTSMYAQNSITGTVSDVSGQPLPGANILEKGTANGTQSDFDGNFSITVANKSTPLVVSYIGFLTQEINVSNQTSITITLQEDASKLDEIIVVGYGTQKRINITGAVETVTASDLADRPSANVSNLLVGQAAGLTLVQRSGQPGGNSGTFRIRGISTLNNNDPLIIVDGIETGSIEEIDPDDIASVTILKDAASSAIYGVRASNGVVLITTKRGEKGAPKVTYSLQTGISDASRQAETASSFEVATLHNEANRLDGNPLLFTDDDIQKYRDGSSPISHPNVNHVDNLFSRTAIFQKHNLSVSGGSDNFNYRVSLGYTDEEGDITSTGFKRYNTRINLDNQISDKLKAGLSISAATSIRLDPSSGGVDGVIHRAYREWPTKLDVNPDGTWAWQINDNGAPVAGPGRPGHNAVAYANGFGARERKETRLRGTFFAEYEIIEGLKLRGSASVIRDNNTVTNRRKYLEFYDWDVNLNGTGVAGRGDLTSFESRINKRFDENTNLNYLATLTYTKDFTDHSLSVLAAYNSISQVDELLEAGRRPLPTSNNLDQIDGAPDTSDSNSGNTIDYGLRSVFGRLNYGYKDKYLVEANLRYDGTSRFPVEGRFEVFPSFSVGWVISKEDFFNVDFISSLKARASWGELGNQNIENYRYFTTYATEAGTSFGGTTVPSILENKDLGNSIITWETKTSKNIGLDAAFFKGKLNFSAEYYEEETKDILVDTTLPFLLGANGPVGNEATVENKGFEFSLGYRGKIGSDLNYSIKANVATNQNEVISVGNPLFERPDRKPGQSIDPHFGYISEGLFVDQAEIDAAPDHSAIGQTLPGDIRYADINGFDAEGNLTGVADGKIDAADRTELGNPFPGLTYGALFGMDYKGFDFSMLWQGAGDVDGAIGGKAIDPFNGAPLKPHVTIDRWTEANPNKNATFPRHTLVRTGRNYGTTSSFFIYDASYLKMRNIQIGYSLPKSTIDKLGLSKLRLFVSADNLITISSKIYKDLNLDPEQAVNGDPSSIFDEIETAYAPRERYVFGLNIAF